VSADNVNDLRSEYKKSDLGRGTRGKYYDDFTAGTNLILLSPDVASSFKDEKSVNDALRSLVKLARESVKQGEDKKK
jgi:hypothetical protein